MPNIPTASLNTHWYPYHEAAPLLLMENQACVVVLKDKILSDTSSVIPIMFTAIYRGARGFEHCITGKMIPGDEIDRYSINVLDFPSLL